MTDKRRPYALISSQTGTIITQISFTDDEYRRMSRLTWLKRCNYEYVPLHKVAQFRIDNGILGLLYD